ncbi:hypothetical protein ACVXHA_26645 [Escherichia coli]
MPVHPKRLCICSVTYQVDGPVIKSLEGAPKAECCRFFGLIHQAIVILEKGRFISPWKHILVDEFQDISPQRSVVSGITQAKTVRRRCSPLVMTGRRFTH